MAVSPILEIQEVAATQTDKTTTINDAIVGVEAAANDQLVVDMSGGGVTLSFTQFARHQVFKCASLAADHKLTIPLLTPTGSLAAKRVFAVRNESSAYNLTVGGATGLTVVLAPLSAAVIQSDGTDCLTYGVGGPGVSGGAVTIEYSFSTSTTNADPGNGFLALNNSTENTATAIFVDLLDVNGTNWTTVLDSLDDSTNAVKGQIRLFNRSNPSLWLVFNITAVTSHTGYRELTVAEIGSSAASPFGASDPLGLAFVRAGDSGLPVLSVVNTWTKRQRTPPIALTDAATIAIDFDAGNNFDVTLGGSRTLANPTNVAAGDGGQIAVHQDGTGSRTLAFGANWFPVGGTPVPLTATPSAVDIITYYAVSTTHISYAILLAA